MEKQEIIAAALAEAARMQACLGQAEADGNIQMTVAQFGRLAGLIAALAAVAGETPAEAAATGLTEQGVPGDPRYWVPLAHFARIKARCDALERLASVGALGLAA